MPDEPNPPAPAPAPQPAPVVQPTTSLIPQLPPYVYIMGMVLGIPVAGTGGAFFGNSQAAKDITALEGQVDELEDQLDAKVEQKDLDDLEDAVDVLTTAVFELTIEVRTLPRPR